MARKTHPGLLASTSGPGDDTVCKEVARAADFLLVHFDGMEIEDMPAPIKPLQKFGKPVVCNEDAKIGEVGARAAANGGDVAGPRRRSPPHELP